MMRVLIGCERFGILREAFRRRGHDAWSCDLVRAADGSPYHYCCDVREVLAFGWDLAIFHPDCTYFTNSAAWAFKDGPYHMKLKPGTLVGAARRAARERDAEFVKELVASPILRKVVENPQGYLSKVLGPATQTIQPNEYGEDASKATCLWLYEVPILFSTRLVMPRMVDGRPRWANQTDSGQNRLSPSPDRAMLRAATYRGIADAMADQWGNL